MSGILVSKRATIAIPIMRIIDIEPGLFIVATTVAQLAIATTRLVFDEPTVGKTQLITANCSVTGTVPTGSVTPKKGMMWVAQFRNVSERYSL